MSAPRYAREIPQRYRLAAARCTSCGKVAFPPRVVCAACRGRSFEALALPDDGTLVTWTIIHVARAALATQTPYVLGVVELSPGVRVTAQIADVDPATLEVGTPLRRVLRKLSDEGPSGIIHYAYKFVPRE